ncbi:ABC transporter substrate-binding protein [Planktothrix mougeotii]|uniref:ABC transporter substrate-binding protein n=1 Tax=Planktothrix mougeotii LEGE 06226 TaxID=1828728 RepID=A0ABR9UBL0_9CYAN|nr:ABC transporter substrate-binding protein [Planktothrix mougeotii]MBE9143850.1 ABC transporter substrate-binding protein [Planktothrix mougeotii LEGE 06226]
MINFARRLSPLGIVLSICLIFLSNCQGIYQKPDSSIHLSLWQSVNPPPNRDVFERLVDKFNQTHTDIQIESIFIGQPQLPKILTAVVGNSPPDLLVHDPQSTGQFAELGAILPLDNWVENLPFKSDIVPGLFEQLSLDGHIWSSPLYTANLGIFYRPKLFQLAGITELPKTWEEFRQVAKKLTIDRNGDGRPEQYGVLLPLGKGEWTVFSWFPFLLSAGGEILTNNQPNFINPGAIHALQFWQDLIKEGSATLSQPERGYEEADFISGRVAMQITGPWTYITKSNVDYDVFPIPADLKPSTVTATGNIYVMKTTPEREKAALKFLEFVLSEEFQTEWAMGTNFLPVNLKSVESQDYQEYLKSRPWLKVFVEQMSVAGSRPIIAGYTRISDTLGSAIEATLLGQSSAESALKEAQKRLEVILGRK